jgi:hypothetical protein
LPLAPLLLTFPLELFVTILQIRKRVLALHAFPLDFKIAIFELCIFFFAIFVVFALNFIGRRDLDVVFLVFGTFFLAFGVPIAKLLHIL